MADLKDKVIKVSEPAIYIVLGLILIIFNKGLSNIATNILGIVIILSGIFRLLRYLLTKSNNFVVKNELYSAIGYIVIGFIILVASDAILRFFTIIIGFLILFSSILKILETTKLAKMKINVIPSLIQAVVLFIISYILLFTEIDTLNIVLIIFGVFLVVSGFSQLYTYIFTQKEVNSKYIEATIIEKDSSER